MTLEGKDWRQTKKREIARMKKASSKLKLMGSLDES
jgi:hypothetical protein